MVDSVSVRFKNARLEKVPLNIRIQWNAGTACVSECVLKTLACQGLRRLRVGPSKVKIVDHRCCIVKAGAHKSSSSSYLATFATLEDISTSLLATFGRSLCVSAHMLFCRKSTTEHRMSSGWISMWGVANLWSKSLGTPLKISFSSTSLVLSLSLSIYLSIYLYIYIYIYMYLPLSLSLSLYIYIYMLVLLHLPVYPSIHLSICLSVSLSIFFSLFTHHYP